MFLKRRAKLGCHIGNTSPFWDVSIKTMAVQKFLQLCLPLVKTTGPTPGSMSNVADKGVLSPLKRLMSSVRISSLQRKRLSLDFASFPIIGFLPGQSPQACTTLPDSQIQGTSFIHLCFLLLQPCMEVTAVLSRSLTVKMYWFWKPACASTPSCSMGTTAAPITSQHLGWVFK